MRNRSADNPDHTLRWLLAADRTLAAALAELTAREQTIVTLVYFDRLPVDVVGRRMRMARPDVTRTLARALRHIGRATSAAERSTNQDTPRPTRQQGTGQ